MRILLVLSVAMLLAGPVSSTATDVKAGCSISDNSPTLQLECVSIQDLTLPMAVILAPTGQFCFMQKERTNLKFYCQKEGQVRNKSLSKLKFNRLRNSK